MTKAKNASIVVPLRFASFIGSLEYSVFLSKISQTFGGEGTWGRSFAEIVARSLMAGSLARGDGEDAVVNMEIDLTPLLNLEPIQVLDLGRLLEKKSGHWKDDVNLLDFLRHLSGEIMALVCDVCDGSGKLGERKKITCPQCGGKKWAK